MKRGFEALLGLTLWMGKVGVETTGRTRYGCRGQMGDVITSSSTSSWRHGWGCKGYSSRLHDIIEYVNSEEGLGSLPLGLALLVE